MSVRRLIEEELPLIEVNKASEREKNLRHGHISTLHLWWARRPLAMSRAVIYGTLLPDPGDERAPTGPEGVSRKQPSSRLRSNPAGSIRCAGVCSMPTVGAPPKVLDCFAGGGAIPLEALRLGCDTTALDLNPVAHLIQKGVLEFPQRFGTDASGGNPLAEAFMHWAGWVKSRAEAELAELFPREDGKPRPSVFFWCRTMTCPNPACGTEVPLLSSLRLADSGSRQTRLRLDMSTDPTGIELVEGSSPEGRRRDARDGKGKLGDVSALLDNSVCHGRTRVRMPREVRGAAVRHSRCCWPSPRLPCALRCGIACRSSCYSVPRAVRRFRRRHERAA